jgi:SAM-dependent methyltransferase
MEPVEGAQSFLTSGEAYDNFMGRYSRPLAGAFADAADVHAGQSALDVGCGPGALTGELVTRLGADAVSAFDPSEPFVTDCAFRHPGVEVRHGRAESIPFDDEQFDRVLAQLVVHFVSDPQQAAAEFRRVAKPGGVVAACVWDADEGMAMLHHFWDAAEFVGLDLPGDARSIRFGRAGELAELFVTADFLDVEDSMLSVQSTYHHFADLWSGFVAGIGPAGTYLLSCTGDAQLAIRDELFRRLGSPTEAFTLQAAARCAVGRAPL